MEPADVTLVHIANAMRMDVAELLDESRYAERLFRPPEKRPIGKKHRLLDIPSPSFKWRLKLLHRFAQKHLPVHDCAHGGVAKRSCFTAAERHCGRVAVVTRDIKDCYPSVMPEAFEAELRALGFAADVAIVLTRLMTVRGRIPQGSPVSGDALNLYLFRSDELIRGEAATFGGRYTRSADDMVISVDSVAAVSAAEALLEREIAANGLCVNVEKRRKNGVLRRHETQLVHNIDVNSPYGTRPSAERSAKALDAAIGYVRGARGASPATIIGLAARRQRVYGHYNDIRQAHRSPAAHVKKLLDAGDRFVAAKLVAAGLGSLKDGWWVVAGGRDEPRRIAALWPRIAL